jgi:hypothetical protein
MKRKPLTPEEKARTWQEIKDVFLFLVMAVACLKVADLLTKL